MTEADRTDHVLDTIDAALRDFGTSPDAMRWTPDGSSSDNSTGPHLHVEPRRGRVFDYTVDTAIQPGHGAIINAETWQSMRAGLEAATAQISAAWDALRSAVVVADRIAPEQQQVSEQDIRERALALRRNRHTGPPATQATERRRVR